MTLSPGDAGIISKTGLTLLSNFVPLCPLFTFLGFYLALFPYSIIILSRKPDKNTATYWLMALTTTLFVFFLSNLLSMTTIFVIEIQGYLVDSNPTLNERNLQVRPRVVNSNHVISVGVCITYIIADTIVMWRAWALYNGNKRVRCLVAFTTVINAGVILANFIMDQINENGLTTSPGLTIGVDCAATFLSFATNLLATFLIAYKAWQHREEIRTCLAVARRTKVQSVLTLLVETGVGLCVLQLSSAVIALFNTTTGTPANLGSKAITAAANSLAAILPTLIIVVVSQKNTSVIESSLALSSRTQVSDEKLGNTPGNSTFVSTIHFAASRSMKKSVLESRSEEG